MPVIASEHSMRLRLNPTGKDCNTAQDKGQWQAMAAPHMYYDQGWVSARPMIDSLAANPRRGAYPLPSANERRIMERRERGRSLTEAGYTIIIPSNAAMRVSSERFFQRLNAKMLDTADLRYFRRAGKGRYDDYNRRERRWCDYHTFKAQWADGRVAKDLSKSICYLLRHEDPKIRARCRRMGSDREHYQPDL